MTGLIVGGIIIVDLSIVEKMTRTSASAYK
jgi:hypothetical protein